MGCFVGFSFFVMHERSLMWISVFCFFCFVGLKRKTINFSLLFIQNSVLSETHNSQLIRMFEKMKTDWCLFEVKCSLYVVNKSLFVFIHTVAMLYLSLANVCIRMTRTNHLCFFFCQLIVLCNLLLCFSIEFEVSDFRIISMNSIRVKWLKMIFTFAIWSFPLFHLLISILYCSVQLLMFVV